MRNYFILFVAACMCMFNGSAQKSFRNIKVDNPVFYANTTFISYEDLSFSGFEALRVKYQLDTIFHGEKDEFKRILLLRHWINKTIPVGVPPPGDFTAEGIIDEALKGVKFWCSYFMIVQNEIMNAYGFIPRVINASDGVPHHHGLNEIWSNTYKKWFLCDAMYDCHLEKNGIPLSALEIRDEYFKNKAADIKLVAGPERTSIDFFPVDNLSKEIYAGFFTWIAWFKQNDIYSNWDNGKSYLIVYEDEYFKHNKWIRVGGKPHWAYGTKFMILTRDRKELYWTPNTITSDVVIKGSRAIIKLNSVTPLFRSYQAKEQPGEDWADVSDTVEIELKKDNNQMLFRVVNLAGVAGPEYKIIITK